MTRSLATARVVSTARVRATEWLLYDQFNVSAAAPLASPRTSDPGPGALTLVQTDGQFSIVGGRLVFPVQTSPVWGDQGFYGAGLSVAAGRALLSSLRVTTLGSSGCSPIAFKPVQSVDIQGISGTRYMVQVKSLDLSVGFGTVGGFEAAVALSTNVDYKFAMVLRLAGVFVFVKGGIYSEWTLLGVSNENIGNTLYPIFSNNNNAGTLDDLKVIDLVVPWNDDYGIATQRLAGSVAAGTAFTHEADCIIEYTVTTVPPTTEINLSFRRQDANNRWVVRITVAGDLILREVVAGVGTTRATASGVITSGERVVIVAAGSTIRMYENNTLRITYNSATNFQTATAGEVTALGDGAVSDLISWPRTLSGQPLHSLEAVANA